MMRISSSLAAWKKGDDGEEERGDEREDEKDKMGAGIWDSWPHRFVHCLVKRRTGQSQITKKPQRTPITAHEVIKVHSKIRVS
jgi:hypothetical protein